MALAAENGDRHLAFMSLASLHEMLSDIGSEVQIGPYNVFPAYDPGDLQKTLENFETLLQKYLKEYEKIGLKPERYADMDAFIETYLQS